MTSKKEETYNELAFDGYRYKDHRYCDVAYFAGYENAVRYHGGLDGHFTITPDGGKIYLPFPGSRPVSIAYFNLWVDLGCPAMTWNHQPLEFKDLLNIALEKSILEG